MNERSFTFLRGLYTRNRYPLYTSMVIYLTGVLLAWIILATSDPDVVAGFASGNDPAQTPVQNDMNILTNNLIATVGIFAGICTFGTSAIVIILASGYVHATAVLLLTPSLPEFVLLFALHSIIEIPGIWIAGSVGLRVPFDFTRYILFENYTLDTNRIALDLVILGTVSIAFIFVAALVEMFISRQAYNYIS
jgi:uncharacterized membrane protein SpoIIM required for sporulation